MGTKYKLLEEYTITSTQNGDDDAGKMFQILVDKSEVTPYVTVRIGYRGPSGTFLNNPPTCNLDKDVEEELQELIPTVWAQARIYEDALETLLNESNFPDERVIGCLDLVSEPEDVNKILNLAEG